MTVKLLLLKSGEDLIADVQEMVSPNEKVIGYFLNKPCVIKMRNPQMFTEDSDRNQQGKFEVSLFPWLPLSKESTIPLPTDWVVTMVEPNSQLFEMYEEDVLNAGIKKQNDQTSNSNESADSIDSN